MCGAGVQLCRTGVRGGMHGACRWWLLAALACQDGIARTGAGEQVGATVTGGHAGTPVQLAWCGTGGLAAAHCSK